MIFFKRKPLFVLGIMILFLGGLLLTMKTIVKDNLVTLVGNLDNKSIDKFEVFLKENKFDFSISNKGDSILVPAGKVHEIRQEILKNKNLKEENFIFARTTQPSFLKNSIKIKQDELALEGLLRKKHFIKKIKKFKNLKDNKDIYVFLFDEESKNISRADVTSIKNSLEIISGNRSNGLLLINTSGKLIYDSSKSITRQTNAELVSKLREAIELEKTVEEVVLNSEKKIAHLVFVDIDKGVERKEFNLNVSLHVDGNFIHDDKKGFNKKNIENYKGFVINEVMKSFFGDFKVSIKETIFSEDSLLSIAELRTKSIHPRLIFAINLLEWILYLALSAFIFMLIFMYSKIAFKRSDNWLFENLDVTSLKNMFKQEPEYLVAAGLQGLKKSDREEIKSIVGQELFDKAVIHIESVGKVSDKLKQKVQEYVYKRYEIYSKYLKSPETVGLDEISSVYQHLNYDEKKAIDWYLKENALSIQESFLPVKVSELQRIKSELFKR